MLLMILQARRFRIPPVPRKAACALIWPLLLLSESKVGKAEEVQFIGRSFEITFVEHQVQNGAGMPKPTDVPGISFATPIDHKQKNRIALTFRPGNNIDYEAERNFGTIFQRDPGRNHSTPIHLLSGASGRIGDWLDTPTPQTTCAYPLTATTYLCVRALRTSQKLCRSHSKARAAVLASLTSSTPERRASRFSI